MISTQDRRDAVTLIDEAVALFVKIVVTLLKRPSLVYYPVVVLG